MDKINNAFESIKEHSRNQPVLGEDFEARVFSKIKKKKAVRRNITAAVAGFTLAGFLFLTHSLVFKNKPNEPIIAQQVNSSASVSEEIPIMDDVVFASSDYQADYAIEQVAYYDENDTI